VNHYLGGNWETYVVLDEPGWADLQPKVAARRRLWVVLFNDTSMWQMWQAQWKTPLPAPLPPWTAWLAQAGFRQISVREYPGRKYMAVYLFERTP
jgi:hypothetical protein